MGDGFDRSKDPTNYQSKLTEGKGYKGQHRKRKQQNTPIHAQ